MKFLRSSRGNGNTATETSQQYRDAEHRLCCEGPSSLVATALHYLVTWILTVGSPLPRPRPSCSDLQMHGGPVDGVLSRDPGEEPLSGHEVVPALL